MNMAMLPTELGQKIEVIKFNKDFTVAGSARG
ncbi:hypothetical protein DYY67_1255 [Candidatus Nitrosotalea sp. TS]|nr:hypothetical protein [Candidatus Nitrosotalea sp. TS]